ncbi:hypothetical protein CXB51_000769 [Gossypium anomalum]|uniref:Uncharacterized protein n=1 Tax=Gossypium anomalum TaxID=47600 RepID=A0A8J6DBL0_9ROSI|nr:hypothetical protein CXB51_000769 [Gossypium anomalum]
MHFHTAYKQNFYFSPNLIQTLGQKQLFKHTYESMVEHQESWKTIAFRRVLGQGTVHGHHLSHILVLCIHLHAYKINMLLEHSSKFVRANLSGRLLVSCILHLNPSMHPPGFSQSL